MPAGVDPYIEAEPMTIEITLDPKNGVNLRQAAHAVGLSPAEWARLAVESHIRLFDVLGGQVADHRVKEAIAARGKRKS